MTYSNFLKSNERLSVRRSNTTGVTPTIPTDEDFTNWLDTDLFDGEFFLNTYDKILWLRTGDTITEILYDSDLTTFLSLTDTPNAYADGYIVTSTSTGLTFSEYPDVRINIVDMDDFVGGDITGKNGYTIIVDEANNGFTYSLIEATTFLDLTDTPSVYEANKILKVNATASDVEFSDIYDIAVDLESNQTIGGEKTFIDDVILSDITVNSIKMTGATISEIKTDLTTSDDDSLPTTKAVTDFVYETITGTFSGSFVTIDNNEEINSEKTFTEDQIFEKDIVVYDEIYLGDKNTDGSYKIRKDNDGELVIEKNNSGTWSYYYNFTIQQVSSPGDIFFNKNYIYYSDTTPMTGDITEDLTDARLGFVQKIYHNDTVEPTFPSGWVRMSGDYFINNINIIFAEYCGDGRVEYWIIQENMTVIGLTETVVNDFQTFEIVDGLIQSVTMIGYEGVMTCGTNGGTITGYTTGGAPFGTLTPANTDFKSITYDSSIKTLFFNFISASKSMATFIYVDDIPYGPFTRDSSEAQKATFIDFNPFINGTDVNIKIGYAL